MVTSPTLLCRLSSSRSVVRRNTASTMCTSRTPASTHSHRVGSPWPWGRPDGNLVEVLGRVRMDRRGVGPLDGGSPWTPRGGGGRHAARDVGQEVQEHRAQEGARAEREGHVEASLAPRAQPGHQPPDQGGDEDQGGDQHVVSEARGGTLRQRSHGPSNGQPSLRSWCRRGVPGSRKPRRRPGAAAGAGPVGPRGRGASRPAPGTPAGAAARPRRPARPGAAAVHGGQEDDVPVRQGEDRREPGVVAARVGQHLALAEAPAVLAQAPAAGVAAAVRVRLQAQVARRADEPVLALVAGHVVGDEARPVGQVAVAACRRGPWARAGSRPGPGGSGVQPCSPRVCPTGTSAPAGDQGPALVIPSGRKTLSVTSSDQGLPVRAWTIAPTVM